MSDLYPAPLGEFETWSRVLRASGRHDFYHLREYHEQAAWNGEGEPVLLVYRDPPYEIALPLLIRPLDGLPGASGLGTGWNDATSVYGYPGPAVSHAELPRAVALRFQRALGEYLRDRRVVSAFSRLHPLLPQRHLLDELGECRPAQETVSINLTAPEADQRAGFRRNHRDGIRHLERQGMVCVPDESFTRLDDFSRIYGETMRRLGAAPRYHFSPGYFRRFVDRLAPWVHLFVCLWRGQTVCAALVMECQGIAQYHLGGTDSDHLKAAPMKLLLDTARGWATARGLRVFHLGGGITARPDDSLLHFKKGFSDRRHTFFTWRCVLFPDVYERLCRTASEPAPDHFFPAYRWAPSAPAPSGA